MSRTHSRVVSSRIGNVGYFDATASRSAERCRCCHSGVRRSGRRRGSSNARAAASRNRLRTARCPGARAVTSCFDLVGIRTQLVDGDVLERLAEAQDDAVVRPQRPGSEPIRSASAPAAPSPTARARARRTATGCTRASRRSRRGSARRRSCGRRASRRPTRPARRDTRAGCSAASSSSAYSLAQLRRSRVRPSLASRTSRTIAPSARPSSIGRPGLSPFQNGIFAGSPGAGVTTTRSCVMSSMRHVDAPSTNVSPGRDSYTISSSSSPTRLPSGRNTPNSPRSGIVPPLVTARRFAPVSRAQRVRTPVPHDARTQLGELRRRIPSRRAGRAPRAGRRR